MYRPVVILCLSFFFAAPAHAGLSEAREVARLNNCPPQKIEVLQTLPGGGKTVYRILCALPKTIEESKTANAILVGCAQSLCALIRPLIAEK